MRITLVGSRHFGVTTLDMLRRQIPLGRIGGAEEAVGAFLFLCSEALSGYVTGQVIEVNGGLLMP